jgi:hypothetical protein
MSDHEGGSSKAEGETIMRISAFNHKTSFNYIGIEYSPKVSDERRVAIRPWSSTGSGDEFS